MGYFEKIITFCAQKAKVNCDGKCLLAEGINKETHGKPDNSNKFPTKWCVRECERCNMSEPGEYYLPLPLKAICNRGYK